MHASLKVFVVRNPLLRQDHQVGHQEVHQEDHRDRQEDHQDHQAGRHVGSNHQAQV
jgi:hypothetical protein